ncbi:MAG: hypothetical protein WCI88_03200 [Chloroflexota bacterium]
MANSLIPDLKSLLTRYPLTEYLARKLLSLAPHVTRSGKNFWGWYAFYKTSESWSRNDLLDYQLGRIRDLLQKAVQESPYYRERLSLGEIANLTSIEQFEKIVPTITKKEFRNQYKNILAESWKSQKLEHSHTSGTTGLPLQFYHSEQDHSREWASICYQWDRVGYKPAESKRVEFRGLTKSGRLMEEYPEQNSVRCSILHLKPEHIRYYAEEIARRKMDFFHGYPSALYLLAREIYSNGIKFPQPKAILLASEDVYDWQLDMIQSVFQNSNIYAHYGCAERTVLAGWCEHRREYHVLPQYALVEVDPLTSEIIGTNLYNHINPFIRYRMTDTALQVDQTDCPDCKISYFPRLMNLGGRLEEYLYSLERGWISPAIVTYPLKDLKLIHEIQFIQNQPGKIDIRFSATASKHDSLLDKEKSDIENGLRVLFGKQTTFHFEQVDDFERSPTGKFRWIICNLDWRDPRLNQLP